MAWVPHAVGFRRRRLVRCTGGGEGGQAPRPRGWERWCREEATAGGPASHRVGGARPAVRLVQRPRRFGSPVAPVRREREREGDRESEAWMEEGFSKVVAIPLETAVVVPEMPAEAS